MSERLSANELTALIRRVFLPTAADQRLGILVDLPDARTPDRPAWRERRAMAADWADQLRAQRDALGLGVSLIVYPNVAANNADLPANVWVADGPLPDRAEALDPAAAMPLTAVLDSHSILLAPTEFSATAPLKLLGKHHGFRAATMPGFNAGMIPALRLDYGEVRRRVAILKDLLDRAEEAYVEFLVDAREVHELTLDLRYRTAHASDGILDRPGMAGNLPSGEAYIVPYEGERDEPSASEGSLPVQFGDEVVVYRIERNRAVGVTGEGRAAREQAELLVAEPAYGNLAELGLGVLGDLGVQPTGEILLDEKLGLHIAFGRSDHFGGIVGAADFSKPEAVVHIDRIYLPGLQPRIVPRRVDLVTAEGAVTELMRDGAYVPGIV